MFLQPRFISFLLSLFIAISTAAFCSLVPGTPTVSVATTFLVALTSSFLLIYFTIEYLIFRELFQINAIFEKLKKKDFKFPKNPAKFKLNPLQSLNKEITLFAQLKQKEIEDLKKIENYRREFIADLSHELKTPIFAAQGYIHTLLDGAMDEPEVSEKFLKKAAKSLDGLDELVQDLLTLSEIETGSAKMKKDQFDLYQVVNEVFDQLEKKASKRNVTLLLDRNIERPIVVEADQKRIFQVIRNLVENGIKYGFEDGGFVKVKLFEDQEGVEITIIDNGPGIPEEDQKRIFDRFYRVEKSRSKDKGGSGLGLAIAKQIIEAHKSKISLSSKSGKGASFSFRLFNKKG
jgi:two-component system phosphate regulon sensor histidine kinase PhoR